jgi:hypothetical protein
MRSPSALEGQGWYGYSLPSVPVNEVVAVVRFGKFRSKPPIYISAWRMSRIE